MQAADLVPKEPAPRACSVRCHCAASVPRRWSFLVGAEPPRQALGADVQFLACEHLAPMECPRFVAALQCAHGDAHRDRHAELMGLICQARSGQMVDEVVLEISGPFSLFRHTRLYARALSTLVPRLSWCRSFRLEADCVLGKGDHAGRLVLRPDDPLPPARELPAHDSKVEERFARAFASWLPHGTSCASRSRSRSGHRWCSPTSRSVTARRASAGSSRSSATGLPSTSSRSSPR